MTGREFRFLPKAGPNDPISPNIFQHRFSRPNTTKMLGAGFQFRPKTRSNDPISPNISQHGPTLLGFVGLSNHPTFSPVL